MLCEAVGLLVDLLDGAHLQADAFEVKLVHLVDTRERAAEVFHFLAVAREFRALLVHFREGFGEQAQFVDIGLRGFLHFGREGGLCAAQQFVVGSADNGGQALCLVFEGFVALRRVERDGLAGSLHDVGLLRRCFCGRTSAGIARSRAAGHNDSAAARAAANHYAAAGNLAFGAECFAFAVGFIGFIIIADAHAVGNFFVRLIVGREFLAHLVLVERTVEGGEEEHHDLRAHTDEEHEVAARQVREFEECAEDNDRCAPAVCVVKESLSRHAVHPVLQAYHDVYFLGHNGLRIIFSRRVYK